MLVLLVLVGTANADNDSGVICDVIVPVHQMGCMG
jgi:hypothetical protein